ncbi:hypothetical protein ACMD2_15898 [Ananas comosus]|uniref:Uncharacterized protein n=1 Tax=Ananas comosus TaxID=4615 RepID=A0A199UPT5_ANACO|nr:hypothetical protein ACMD2_15898 [Ananas comosus]
MLSTTTTTTTSTTLEKPLQLKEGNKLYSKLLSKESSLSNPSFRVYYALDSVGIPFLWESQPGKPKSASMKISSTSLLPPLTPPPSYYSNPAADHKAIFAKKPSKFNILHVILPKIPSIRKIRVPSLLCFRLRNGTAARARESYSAVIMARRAST